MTLLVRAVAGAHPESVVDLGCGTGELLLRIVEATPGAEALGIDLDSDAIAAVREEAERRGLSDRVRFVEGDIREYRGNVDALVCIGAAHAWGGTADALRALRERGGRLLFGWGFWAAGPSRRSLEIIGEGIPDSLDALRAATAEAGWVIEDEHVATEEEWDAFERAWCEGRDPEMAARHWDEYEYGYRGELGFGYFLLAGDSSLRSPKK